MKIFSVVLKLLYAGRQKTDINGEANGCILKLIVVNIPENKEFCIEFLKPTFLRHRLAVIQILCC
jgi:hypothetical protein